MFSTQIQNETLHILSNAQIKWIIGSSSNLAASPASYSNCPLHSLMITTYQNPSHLLRASRYKFISVTFRPTCYFLVLIFALTICALLYSTGHVIYCMEVKLYNDLTSFSGPNVSKPRICSSPLSSSVLWPITMISIWQAQ